MRNDKEVKTYGFACPKCGSKYVSGLIAAFWAPANVDQSEIDWHSNTEMGPERCCGKCEHQWIHGDDEADRGPKGVGK